MVEEGQTSGKQLSQHQQSKSVSGGNLQSLSVLDESAMLARETMSPGQVLLQIHAARGRLRNTNDFIKMLGYSSLVPELATSEGDDADKTSRPSGLSNILNLLSTFLYMSKFARCWNKVCSYIMNVPDLFVLSSSSFYQPTIILWHQHLLPTRTSWVRIVPSLPLSLE